MNPPVRVMYPRLRYALRRLVPGARFTNNEHYQFPTTQLPSECLPTFHFTHSIIKSLIVECVSRHKKPLYYY